MPFVYISGRRKRSSWSILLDKHSVSTALLGFPSPVDNDMLHYNLTHSSLIFFGQDGHPRDMTNSTTEKAPLGNILLPRG